ncbi:YARHG domain-containing protein, partial [Lusitaniella coriacea]
STPKQTVPPTIPSPLSTPQQIVPPTIPAPPSTSPPRESKNTIVSSLIIGGLVSAAVVAGFFLIKPKDSENPIINSANTPAINNACPWVTNDPQPPTNVRSTPGQQDNNIVGTIANGTEVSVVMEENGWLKINAPREGWISAKLARNTCNSTPNTAQNSPTPQPQPTPRRQSRLQTNYDWLSEREVTAEDLQGKTAFELSIMRNSIFARRGRKFDARELQTYFNNQTWYNPKYEPNAFPNDVLTRIERQNAAYILQYQNENNLRWIAEKLPEQPERPSVTQALVDYYSLINRAQYESAWTQLSKTFQNNSAVHPEGYTSYTNWWTQVNRVELGEMNVVESSAEVARVEVALTFKMQNGKESPLRIRFKFIWDEENEKWLIDDTKGL